MQSLLLLLSLILYSAHFRIKDASKLYKEVVFETVGQEFFLNNNKTNSDDNDANDNNEPDDNELDDNETNSEELPKEVEKYLKKNSIKQANTEPEVREWFRKLLKQLSKTWPNDLTAKDTHKDSYLCSYMPDFSIVIDKDALTPFAVQTILELKKYKRTSGFSDEDKGQLIDYLHILV